jgi:hypothetical protein
MTLAGSLFTVMRLLVMETPPLRPCKPTFGDGLGATIIGQPSHDHLLADYPRGGAAQKGARTGREPWEVTRMAKVWVRNHERLPGAMAISPGRLRYSWGGGEAGSPEEPTVAGAPSGGVPQL